MRAAMKFITWNAAHRVSRADEQVAASAARRPDIMVTANSLGVLRAALVASRTPLVRLDLQLALPHATGCRMTQRDPDGSTPSSIRSTSSMRSMDA